MRLIVRILLFVLNALISLALLCCILAQYINPSSFPYCELLALGFPIIVIINIIASVCWIVAKDHKRYFLISFISLVLSIPTQLHYVAFGNDETPQEKKNSIKIMSYNIMAFNYLGWEKNNEIKQQIFLYILKENPDVICLQEYHNDRNEKFIVLDSIKQQMNLSYVNYNKTFTIGDHYFQGNLICSRYPIVNSGKMDYQKTGNSTIWADIVKDGDTIRIYNSHLESYRLSHENKQTINDLGKVQNVEIKNVENVVTKLSKAITKRGVQTDELIYSLKECPYPIISCGDFNSPACSYTYQAIKSSRDLEDAFLAAGKGIGATFNWWPQLRLDYILVSPEFKCYNFKRTGLKVSDHFPISCTVQLK